MNILLLIGIALAGLPTALIIGFAAYIFLGFVNDDKDAKAIFTIALISIGIGIILIISSLIGKWVTFS